MLILIYFWRYQQFFFIQELLYLYSNIYRLPTENSTKISTRSEPDPVYLYIIHGLLTDKGHKRRLFMALSDYYSKNSGL